MSYVTPPRRVRVSQPRRVADSYDGRPSSDRSTTRPYSSYQFMRDVHGYTRARKPRQSTLARQERELATLSHKERIQAILAGSKWNQHDYTQG